MNKIDKLVKIVEVDEIENAEDNLWDVIQRVDSEFGNLLSNLEITLNNNEEQSAGTNEYRRLQKIYDALSKTYNDIKSLLYTGE